MEASGVSKLGKFSRRTVRIHRPLSACRPGRFGGWLTDANGGLRKEMIFVEINFGRSRSLQKCKLEDIAETYLASLFHSGQLCGEYLLTWIKSDLICHALTSG